LFSSNPPAHPLAPGSIVDDAYRVSKLSAHNASSCIYTATHLMLGRNVTLQLLTSASDKAMRRFRRAARILSMMHHPNVVTVHDMGKHDGMPYVVLEYLAGQSLAERSSLRGALRIDEFAPIAEQVLSALAYVHDRKVIHRDVSADNLILTESHDGGEIVKLTQFSFSKEVGGTTYTSASEQQRLVAALTHVAPEQILTPDEVDHRVDLYAAGAVFYRLLTGVPPFQAKSLAELGGDIIERDPPPLRDYASVPPLLEEVVLQALSKKPEMRFESADAMWRALEQGVFQI